jgi:hypothetical protein
MAWIGKYLGRTAHVAKDIDGFGAPVWIGTLEAPYALRRIDAAATAVGS